MSGEWTGSPLELGDIWKHCRNGGEKVDLVQKVSVWGWGGSGYSVCLGGFDLTALLSANGHDKERGPDIRCHPPEKQTMNWFIKRLMPWWATVAYKTTSKINYFCTNQCNFLDATDKLPKCYKQCYANESPMPRTTGCTWCRKYTLPKKFSKDASMRDDKWNWWESGYRHRIKKQLSNHGLHSSRYAALHSLLYTCHPMCA